MWVPPLLMLWNGPTPALIAWVMPRAVPNAVVKPTALRKARSRRQSAKWRRYRSGRSVMAARSLPADAAPDQRFDLPRLGDLHRQHDPRVERGRRCDRHSDGEYLGDQRVPDQP